MVGLAALLLQIDRAPSERAIGHAIVAHLPKALGISHPGLTLIDSKGEVRDAQLRVPYRFADDYATFGKQHDPVVRRALITHVPQMVPIAALRKALPRHSPYGVFISEHAPRGGIGYCVSPVIVGGRVAGVIQFISHGDAQRTVAGLMALALHASSRASVLDVLDSARPLGEEILTRREREVATLAARGCSVPQVAGELGISPNTVKKYLKSAYAKLGVGSRVELARRLTVLSG